MNVTFMLVHTPCHFPLCPGPCNHHTLPSTHLLPSAYTPHPPTPNKHSHPPPSEPYFGSFLLNHSSASTSPTP